MRAKLIVALVGSVLTIGMATTVASAGRGGPPNPSDPEVGLFELNPNGIENPHQFRTIEDRVVTLLPPEPLRPETSDHCRWTGYNGGEVDGDLDSAYWLYYREYYNQLGSEMEPSNPHLGSQLYGKQGDCMKNKVPAE